MNKFMKYQLYRYDLVVRMFDMHVCGPRLISLSGSLAFLPSTKTNISKFQFDPEKHGNLLKRVARTR